MIKLDRPYLLWLLVLFSSQLFADDTDEGN